MRVSDYFSGMRLNFEARGVSQVLQNRQNTYLKTDCARILNNVFRVRLDQVLTIIVLNTKVKQTVVTSELITGIEISSHSWIYHTTFFVMCNFKVGSAPGAIFAELRFSFT
jgi:hypothetical protein